MDTYLWIVVHHCVSCCCSMCNYLATAQCSCCMLSLHTPSPLTDFYHVPHRLGGGPLHVYLYPSPPFPLMVDFPGVFPAFDSIDEYVRGHLFVCTTPPYPIFLHIDDSVRLYARRNCRQHSRLQTHTINPLTSMSLRYACPFPPCPCPSRTHTHNKQQCMDV